MVTEEQEIRAIVLALLADGTAHSEFMHLWARSIVCGGGGLQEAEDALNAMVATMIEATSQQFPNAPEIWLACYAARIKFWVGMPHPSEN